MPDFEGIGTIKKGAIGKKRGIPVRTTKSAPPALSLSAQPLPGVFLNVFPKFGIIRMKCWPHLPNGAKAVPVFGRDLYANIIDIGWKLGVASQPR